MWRTLIKITFILICLGNTASAGTLLCQAKNSWLKHWYDVSFFEFNSDTNKVRIGGENWLPAKTFKYKKIPNGHKYQWKQTMVVTNAKAKGKKHKFQFNMIVDPTGRSFLRMMNNQAYEKTWDMICK